MLRQAVSEQATMVSVGWQRHNIAETKITPNK